MLLASGDRSRGLHSRAHVHSRLQREPDILLPRAMPTPGFHRTTKHHPCPPYQSGRSGRDSPNRDRHSPETGDRAIDLERLGRAPYSFESERNFQALIWDLLEVLRVGPRPPTRLAIRSCVNLRRDSRQGHDATCRISIFRRRSVHGHLISRRAFPRDRSCSNLTLKISMVM